MREGTGSERSGEKGANAERWETANELLQVCATIRDVVADVVFFLPTHQRKLRFRCLTPQC